MGQKGRYRVVCAKCWFYHSIEGCSKEELAALSLHLMYAHMQETEQRWRIPVDELERELEILRSGGNPYGQNELEVTDEKIREESR